MSTDLMPNASLLDELFGKQLASEDALHQLQDGPGSKEAGLALLEVLAALKRYTPGDAPVVFTLGGVADAPKARLLDVLGAGEVTITVRASRVWRIKESALHGLWHIERLDEAGKVEAELLEVADVPAVVRAADQKGTFDEVSIGEPPQGAMNVLPVLAELRARSAKWQPGTPNHVISFTLLPMNDVDMKYLEQQLGHGPVVGESKGYGHCRVELTQRRHVWSVQHFNSTGALVLDTLEVGDVPVSLLAAKEDFEDSAERLAQLLGV